VDTLYVSEACISESMDTYRPNVDLGHTQEIITNRIRLLEETSEEIISG
jgi:hypothetical protein